MRILLHIIIHILLYPYIIRVLYAYTYYTHIIRILYASYKHIIHILYAPGEQTMIYCPLLGNGQ